MSGITLQHAQTQLALWLKADEVVSRGQSYSHQGRTLTRADAKAITDKIDYWNGKVMALKGTTRRGISRVTLL